MKKIFQRLPILSSIIIILVLSSCNKDKTEPVITILGSNPVPYHCRGMEYLDEGATAYDDEDGDVTDKIETSINVNSNSVGTYTVTYKVSDAAGNTAVETRSVNVIECK